MKSAIKALVFIFLACLSNSLNAQEKTSTGNAKDTTSFSFVEIDKLIVAPGCDEDATQDEIFECFISFITNHISTQFQYPQEAREAGREGRVWIEFIIEKDGEVSNVAVKRSSGVQSIDDEGIRVMKLLPKMKSPAYVDDHPVRMYYLVPINARFNN